LQYARTAWRNDIFACILEQRIDQNAHALFCLPLIAGIDERLTAAGLPGIEINRAAKLFQKLDGFDSDVGEDIIGNAGNKEGNSHPGSSEWKLDFCQNIRIFCFE
jgi:hypothetical protein